MIAGDSLNVKIGYVLGYKILSYWKGPHQLVSSHFRYEINHDQYFLVKKFKYRQVKLLFSLKRSLLKPS